jgi:hypothetical protein
MYFPNEDTKIASLIIRKRHRKTTIRYHLIPDGMGFIQKTRENKC